jgi:hypothetical protein
MTKKEKEEKLEKREFDLCMHELVEMGFLRVSHGSACLSGQGGVCNSDCGYVNTEKLCPRTEEQFLDFIDSYLRCRATSHIQ